MGTLYEVSGTTGATETSIVQVPSTLVHNQTIPSGFNASVPVFYAIALGVTFTVSLGSYFQIT